MPPDSKESKVVIFFHQVEKNYIGALSCVNKMISRVISGPAYFKNAIKILEIWRYRSGINIISMRRFCLRPSSVSFVSTGL